VLTTNGSGTLGFENQRVAGSTLFTATGAITAGKTVALNSDGTVSQVSSSGGSLSLGSYATLTAGTETDFTRTMIYDPDEGVLVVFYVDSGDIYGVVGTVTGTSISWGSPVAAGLSVTASTVDAAYDTTRDEFLIVFGIGGGGPNPIQSIQATVSGGSVSFDGNTITTLSQIGTDSVRGERGAMVTYDPITNRFVLCGVYGLGTAFFSMGVPGASGVTWAAPGVVFSTDVTSRLRPNNKAYNTTNGRSCFAFTRQSEERYHAIEIEVDLLSASVTQTGGGAVQDVPGQNLTGGVAYSAAENRYFLPSFRQGQSTAFVQLFSFVSGGAPSGFATTLSFLPTTSFGRYGISILYNPGAARLLLFVTETGNAAKVYEQLPGGSFSAATAISSVARTPSFPVFPVMDETANKLYSLVGNEAAVITPSSAASTADNWVGIAESNVSNAATGFVTLLGGINDKQSSLTVGAVYYVDSDGGVTTSVTPYGKIGKAISATELLVTEGNA
jgi:hypothetical protein